MRRFALAAGSALLAAACGQVAANAPPPRPVAEYLPPGPQPQPSPLLRAAEERLHAQRLYDGPADGLPHPAMDAALTQFQAAHGLAISGRLDAATRRLLVADVRDNAVPPAIELSDPAAVARVQRRLEDLGLYRGAADGRWGPKTRDALQRFQRDRGLEATGDPTEPTLSALGLAGASGSSLPRR